MKTIASVIDKGVDIAIESGASERRATDAQDNTVPVVAHKAHSLLYVATFLLASTFVVFLNAILYYCLQLTKNLYSSMIIWRGLNLNQLGMQNFYDIMDSITNFFVFKLNFAWVAYLMRPLIRMIDFFASLQIDLGAVEVTCLGSQAPVELLVNLGVLCFVVLTIESSFELYMRAVMELNLKIGRSLSYHDPVLFDESSTDKVGIPGAIWRTIRKALIIVLCFSFSAIISADPMIKVLQSLMTFLTFTKFVEKDGMLHESTEACDQALTEAPMIDSYLAILASLFFWWLVFPTIYCLAKVFTPYGDKIPNRYMPQKYRSDLNKSLQTHPSSMQRRITYYSTKHQDYKHRIPWQR